MFSNIDIENKIESGKITIEPFEELCLSALGYDLRLVKYGYSLDTK